MVMRGDGYCDGVMRRFLWVKKMGKGVAFYVGIVMKVGVRHEMVMKVGVRREMVMMKMIDDDCGEMEKEE